MMKGPSSSSSQQKSWGDMCGDALSLEQYGWVDGASMYDLGLRSTYRRVSSRFVVSASWSGFDHYRTRIYGTSQALATH